MPTPPAELQPAQHTRHRAPLLVLAGVLLVLGLVAALLVALAPVLPPFLLAAIFAYIGNPMVGALQRRGINRSVGAALAIASFFALAALMVGVLIPLAHSEISKFIQRLPALIEFVHARINPWLEHSFGIAPKWDAASLRGLLSNHSEGAQNLLGNLLQSLGSGGAAVLGLLATLLVAPVVMFYLLRDWPQLCRRCARLIPRPARRRTRALMNSIDRVLAEFLRGQLAVMASLALFYSVALAAAGMDYALPVGLITGFMVFVPYVGFGVGFALAMLVSLQQGWPVWGAVLAVFALGQLLESFVLTPRLVGERIGLHPVAVIFALMAFGQLFGFVGVLLALPASAVLLVALREVRSVYLRSDFYQGRESL
jgi:predicted PurR-regulated permease PerM